MKKSILVKLATIMLLVPLIMFALLFAILFLPRTSQAKTYIATAYCPCEKCCGKCDGITATGTKAKEGRTVATGKELIGKTLLVYVDDSLYGIYECEDTGGAIKGNRIDVFFDSHKSALVFGKKKVKVIILDAKG